jgi:hypothetical protein
LQSARWQIQNTQPLSYQLKSKRNMTGFILMVPLSISGKTTSQKIQTEPPPTFASTECGSIASL